MVFIYRYIHHPEVMLMLLLESLDFHAVLRILKCFQRGVLKSVVVSHVDPSWSWGWSMLETY
jgi:hypothetical protein